MRRLPTRRRCPRQSDHPVYLWNCCAGLGVITNLSFGITLIAAQFVWGPKKLWHDVSPAVLEFTLSAPRVPQMGIENRLRSGSLSWWVFVYWFAHTHTVLEVYYHLFSQLLGQSKNVLCWNQSQGLNFYYGDENRACTRGSTGLETQTTTSFSVSILNSKEHIFSRRSW